jgi:hypothetical protein
MPEYLKAFLSGLTPEQADEVWLWFDGNPDAALEVIEIVAPIAAPDGGDPLGEKLAIRGTES